MKVQHVFLLKFFTVRRETKCLKLVVASQAVRLAADFIVYEYVLQPLPDSFIAPKCEQAIEILYQDEAILLINKPSGLLSLSGKNPANLDSVHYRLCQDFPVLQPFR